MGYRALVCEVYRLLAVKPQLAAQEAMWHLLWQRVRPETASEHKIRDILHVDSRDEDVVILYPLRFHASVAQMVEQLTCNQ